MALPFTITETDLDAAIAEVNGRGRYRRAACCLVAQALIREGVMASPLVCHDDVLDSDTRVYYSTDATTARLVDAFDAEQYALIRTELPVTVALEERS